MYAVFLIVRVAVPDDVGHDFLEDQLTLVPSPALEIVAIESPPEIREGPLEACARSRKGQNVSVLHILGDEPSERLKM